MVDPFRFLFMADCQLGCYAAFSGMTEADVERFAARDMRVEVAARVTGHEWDARRYARAVAMANTLSPAFVVMGGDMVDDPADPAQYATLQELTAALVPPMHWVPGNHDVGKDTQVPSADSLADYRTRFGADHYVLQYRGATIVVINTTVWIHPTAVPGTWDEELAFLQTALCDARARAGPTIVCGHHPPFTHDADEPDSYWNLPTERRHLLLDLLDGHRVDAFLCGHWHRNRLLRHRGVEIAITGPVGYPLGADPSGFRVVDVTDEGIRHHYLPLTDIE